MAKSGSGSMTQGIINWWASSNLDFIQNYFFLKCMCDFFDNRYKCRKPGLLRGNIYTSCIFMILLDHFSNNSNTFQHSLPLSLSHFLLWSPLPPIPDPRIAQLMVPCHDKWKKNLASWIDVCLSFH